MSRRPTQSRREKEFGAYVLKLIKAERARKRRERSYAEDLRKCLRHAGELNRNYTRDHDPLEACICGDTVFWRTEAGTWRCRGCFPPSSDEAICWRLV